MTDNVQKIPLPTFFGKKSGMTRIFDEAGRNIPVTVVQLIPNYICQVKTQEKDGYSAYQVGYYTKREKLLNRPTKGHLKKAQVTEFVTRFTEVLQPKTNPEFLGKQVSLDDFKPATYIDVTGISKGKGFQGVIKRFNFAGGPGAHGSQFHRRTGSIGNRATPARVFPLKKMPGHMGCDRKTVQNLQIVAVNESEGYLLVKGSIPGHKNSIIKISQARKKQG